LTLTGWVEDVRPFIVGATVYVAPLRMGSGTRLKLLEAMSLGKAIVSTRLGAEGLVDLKGEPVRDGREMVLVDDDAPLAFAQAVVALLRDPDRRVELGRAARAFVQANYDWRVIIPRLEALYACPSPCH
jgi:glycosyltransferase involved in cell wall biosynthesis